MNTRTSYVVMAILAAVVATSTSMALVEGSSYDELACPDCGDVDVYTQENLAIQNTAPIQVWTDAGIYDHESQITVEGTVANIRSGADVGLVVIGPPPFNNIIQIAQVPVSSEGTFTATFSTAGNPWKYDGTYTIKASYGTGEVSDRAQVQLTGGIIGGPTVTCAPNEFAASGQCIPYSISGATVTGARLNVGTTSMIIDINTSSDGTITLDIPRNVLDTDASADPLFVLVDGEEVESEETVTSSKRTVTIMFPDGAEEIEIIGTFVIPEFGTIAALILAVAIISIIAVTARTRLNVLPKY